MRVRRHRVDLRPDDAHGVAVPVTPRPMPGGGLLKTIANLLLFVGVCTFAGITGWLLGLLVLNLGGNQ